MRTELTRGLQLLGWLLRKSGPYVAIEILMPGGTLLALLLFLYQRRQAALRAGKPDPIGQAWRRVVDGAAGLVAPPMAMVRAGVRTVSGGRGSV